MLGGTFNPPHRGHVALARHARAQLALARVLLVPAHTAPYKAGEDAARDPGPLHRLRMCELALAGAGGEADSDGVGVCALEIERGGVSYTVDTLRELHDRHPHAELTLIVGADVAGTLAGWREPRQLLELAELAVAARPGTPAPELPAELREAARARVLRMPELDVSSSLVRRRVARREPVEDLVGGAVARYIAEHELYRSASLAAGARA